MSQLRSTNTRGAGWKARLVTTIAAIAALAGPAAADDLVSNLGESALTSTNEEELGVNDFAQSFTTGTNGSGYRLESVSIDFATGRSRTYEPVYVYLYPDKGNNRPNHGEQLARLTKNGFSFEGPVLGVNKYTVRKYGRPAPFNAGTVHLDAGTRYWVIIWAGETASTVQVGHTGPNQSGATGWSIGDSALIKPDGTGTHNYTQSASVMRMKVEGKTNPEVLVSITDVTVTEGVELTADFVVSLSRAATGTVQVSYSTNQLTGTSAATEGSDYELRSGTLTFKPGERRKTVSVPILDDARNEGDELFEVQLSNLTGANFGDDHGDGTIVNADALALSISNATATEGVDATIDFTVSLNRATNRRFTVNVLFSSDFSDITDPGEPLVFEPGDTVKTYSFGVVDDTVNEPSETFSVVLQVPGLLAADLIVGSPGTGTILNTEILTGSFENVPQDHDGSTAFTFDAEFNNDIAIGYADMRDHAFTVTNGDVTGASRVDGRSDSWEITVEPDGDDAVTITLPGNRACATTGAICSKEEHPVQLSNSPAATVAAPPEGDPLTASFSNVPDSHDGGDFFVDLTFSEDPDVGYRDVQKAVKVNGGSINRANRKTKGSNVGWKLKVRPTGTDSLTITLSATMNCSARGAICTEDGRRLTNSPSATVAGAGAVVETTPSVSIAGGSGKEGDDDSIDFTVTLDEAASETVTVDYATSDGSAEAGNDYTATSGTLSFSAGDTRKTISVAISDDNDNESDETFTVTLSNASGADLGTQAATGTIRNRTVTPLTASFSGVPAEHTGEEFTFALTFSEDVAGLSYLTLRDVALSATGTTGGKVQRARRQQQGSNQGWTIHVEPESHTAVTVRLPAGSVESSDGRALSHSLSARVAGPVGIAVSDARVEEAAGAVLSFAVTLSRAASGTVTVDYTTSNGTATAGADYTATSGTLTFTPGDVSKTVSVPVLDDTHDDGGETFTLTLSNASGARISGTSATGTIENSDPMPQAWLARFGRAASGHVVEAISERWRDGAAQTPETHFTLGGRQVKGLFSAWDGMGAKFAPTGADNGHPGLADESTWARMDRLGAEALAGPAGGNPAGSSLAGSSIAGGGLNAKPVSGGIPPAGGGLAGDGLAGRGPAGSGTSVGQAARSALMNSLGLPTGDLRDVLMGSSFFYSKPLDENGEPEGPGWFGQWSAWGETAATQFSGADGKLSLDGEVATAILGVDSRWQRWLAGVTLSRSQGEGAPTRTRRRRAVA